MRLLVFFFQLVAREEGNTRSVRRVPCAKHAKRVVNGEEEVSRNQTRERSVAHVSMRVFREFAQLFVFEADIRDVAIPLKSGRLR